MKHCKFRKFLNLQISFESLVACSYVLHTLVLQNNEM